MVTEKLQQIVSHRRWYNDDDWRSVETRRYLTIPLTLPPSKFN